MGGDLKKYERFSSPRQGVTLISTTNLGQVLQKQNYGKLWQHYHTKQTDAKTEKWWANEPNMPSITIHHHPVSSVNSRQHGVGSKMRRRTNLEQFFGWKVHAQYPRTVINRCNLSQPNSIVLVSMEHEYPIFRTKYPRNRVIAIEQEEREGGESARAGTTGEDDDVGIRDGGGGPRRDMSAPEVLAP